MVTHGSWPLTKRALVALQANTEPPYELIVVDNHSEDETPMRLSELRDARVILNGENRGFGPASNQGAEHARSEHLVLLNADAFVQPGWLPPLLETGRRRDVGAVVGRLLHPDGSLQEAGALLAQDGGVVVYGDGDDPGRLCYRFRRVVDFGGAACMLIRRSTFRALDGFDEGYAPAYYEDTDLCMRLGEHGLSVVYEPGCTVTHVRYGSGTSTAAVELSERNRRRFVERWRPRLTGRPWSFSGAGRQAVIAARDAPATPRVLIRAPAGDSTAQALAFVLLDGWPRARVTWWAGPLPGFDRQVDAWLQRGLEVVDREDPGWLEDRLFHYDLVVTGSSSPLIEIDETQPQAAQLPLEQLAGPMETLVARLIPALATAGIAPPTALDRLSS